MTILAVDPGTSHSAYVGWNGRNVLVASDVENKVLLDILSIKDAPYSLLVIEGISHMGMPAGEEVFETVFWSGRFAEAWEEAGGRFDRMKRTDVKLHMCGSSRAKDANVAQSVRDRIGQVGTKKNPGPCYGVSGHMWQALALAVAYWDQNKEVLNEER